jgi:selenium donor protein
VVGFPSNRLPVAVLEDILTGARKKTDEAGIAIIGGHTVDDTEPKFGLAVSGIVDPDKIITNRGARPGDVLVLTKPLGTGILSTALKQGLLEDDQADLLMDTMAALNRGAAEAMLAVGVNACTDVTGFGLLGHLLEMMRGSDTSAVVEAGRIPFLPGVVELAASGVTPGGSVNNLEFTRPSVEYAEKITDLKQLLLNDAQTSGGLLIAVPGERLEDLLARLEQNGIQDAPVIGEVLAESDPRIRVKE